MKRYLLLMICAFYLSGCEPDDILPEEDTPPEDVFDLDDILGDYQTHDSHYFRLTRYEYNESGMIKSISTDTTITVKEVIHTISPFGTDSFHVPYRRQILKPYFKYIPGSLLYLDSTLTYEKRILQFYPEQDSFYFELRFKMSVGNESAVIYHILKGKRME